MFARRGFELSADEEARIDACTTLATLEHWIDEAVVASSAAEALLATRGIAVEEAVRLRILGCLDEANLDRWLVRAVTARSAEEVVALS